MLGHWRNQLHFQVHDYNECKISYCDQIKFYEPVLQLGIPEKQHITNHYFFYFVLFPNGPNLGQKP